MITRVQKWGNSQGLRLSRDLLAEVEIGIGDVVEVTERHGTLVITPKRVVRGRYDLRELVRDIPLDSKAEEFDWGPPQGKEVW